MSDEGDWSLFKEERRGILGRGVKISFREQQLISLK